MLARYLRLARVIFLCVGVVLSLQRGLAAPVQADLPAVVSSPSVTLIESFFRENLERKSVRDFAWEMALLGDQGLRAENWKKVVYTATSGQKLEIELCLDDQEVEAANLLLDRLRVSEFIQIRKAGIEVQGPRKRDEAEALELTSIQTARQYGNIGAGFSTLLVSMLLGYASLSEIQSDGHVAHMTMSISDSPVWKKMLPYLTAGLVSLTYHLLSGKIKSWWGAKIFNPNRFWSRFLIEDSLLPLLVIFSSSFVAILPPSVVPYHGMSLNSFVAILLSAVSLNFFQSSVQRGINTGELNRLSGERHIAFWSVYTGAARSWVINSGGALGGILMQLGMMALVSVPAWLKVTKVNKVFDEDTARVLSGEKPRWSGVCKKALQFIVRPRRFSISSK